MSKIKEILKNEKYYSIIIILIASIFICIPLMSKNIDMTYDDGIQHIARIIGTYQSLQEGETAIMSNFCNGFGYSWNLFYSPLTAFAPLIFKIFGASFTVCIKWFMFLVVFISGYFMYLFTKKITKNNNIAIIASILYIFAPYRLTDMYIRNALAELTSFVFLPLIFLGLYNIFNEQKNEKKEDKKITQLKEKYYIKNSLILTLGTVGLILTHTIVTMYTAIFAIIYVIINYKKLKDKKVLKVLLINTILILVITAFFWVPLLQHKTQVDYEVFKEGRMERTEVLVAYKLDFYRLFFTKSNDYMIYDIGIITLLGLVFTPLAIKKIKNKSYYKIYKFALISGIISCIMTLKIFPFEYLPRTLKMIQFSFRLLEFSSFFFALVSAINIATLSKKVELKELIILLSSIMVLTVPYTTHLRTIDYIDEQRLINTVPVTENTGRVHAGCASFEYLPCKAFENRSYIEKRSQDAIILSGNAQIENANKNGSKMNFDVNYVLEETKIELPYIYYLGYDVTLEQDGKKEKLKTYETENGFVGITVPITEKAKIEMKYEGTFAMKISGFISVIGICAFIGILFLGSEEKNKILTNKQYKKLV